MAESVVQGIGTEMSLAHGRMQTTINGEPWYNGGPNYIVIAQSEEKYSGWLIIYSSKRPGSFFFELAPGPYRIMSMRIGRASLKEERFIEPTPFTFDIPEPGKAYYLGDLTIDFRGEEHFWKSTLLDGVNDISIVDNYDEAKSILISQNLYWDGNSEKLLMKQDDSIEINNLQLIEPGDSKYNQMKLDADDEVGWYEGLKLFFDFFDSVESMIPSEP